MSYHGLAAADPGSGPSLPDDVAPTLVHEMVSPVDRRRGWVAVPTYDMREYVKTQLFTIAAGFTIGMSVGALFGNAISNKSFENALKKVVKNPSKQRRLRKTSRRVSTRAKRRGRPAGKTVTDVLNVRMGGIPTLITIDRGVVRSGGRKCGHIYDLGSKFQALPLGAEPRPYGVLADAAKYVVRASRKS